MPFARSAARPRLALGRPVKPDPPTRSAAAREARLARAEAEVRLDNALKGTPRRSWPRSDLRELFKSMG